MRGLELNGNLLSAGVEFLSEARTDGNYRLWSIKDRHPAMLRDLSGSGTSIELEIWQVPVENI